MIKWVIKMVVLSAFFVTQTLASPPPVKIAHEVPKDDACMAWVIDNEARGEPLRGQRAVYDVVRHRMEVKNLSACAVVKEPYQFSGYHKGMKLVATEEMLRRLEKVRRIAPVARNATFFHSKDVKPTWAAKMKRILTIGRHTFYVFRKPKEKKQ